MRVDEYIKDLLEQGPSYEMWQTALTFMKVISWGGAYSNLSRSDGDLTGAIGCALFATGAEWVSQKLRTSQREEQLRALEERLKAELGVGFLEQRLNLDERTSQVRRDILRLGQ
jgi:hypothetical protein